MGWPSCLHYTLRPGHVPQQGIELATLTRNQTLHLLVCRAMLHLSHPARAKKGISPGKAGSRVAEEDQGGTGNGEAPYMSASERSWGGGGCPGEAARGGKQELTQDLVCVFYWEVILGAGGRKTGKKGKPIESSPWSGSHYEQVGSFLVETTEQSTPQKCLPKAGA